MEKNTKKEKDTNDKKMMLTIYSKDVQQPLLYRLPENADHSEEINKFLKGQYVFSNETKTGWYINPQSVTLITIAEAQNAPEQPQQIEAQPQKPEAPMPNCH